MQKYLFNPEVGSDYIKWIECLEQHNINLYSTKISNEQIASLESAILLAKDSILAYFFCIDFNYNLYKMQKVILECKSPKYIYLFAQNISNADIKALQSAIISSQNIKYICKFACNVPQSNLKLLEKIIFESKNIKYINALLKHTKKYNTNKYKNFIIESKSPRYLFELAKHISNSKEILQIEDLLIKSKSLLYIRLFAAKIKHSNIDKLEQAILESGNIKEIKKFAKSVKKSKLKNFLLVS